MTRLQRFAQVPDALASGADRCQEPGGDGRPACRSRQLDVASLEGEYHAGLVADRGAQCERLAAEAGSLRQASLAHRNVSQRAKRPADQSLVACRTKVAQRGMIERTRLGIVPLIELDISAAGAKIPQIALVAQCTAD